MGSKADLPFAERVAVVLGEFGLPAELRIASAHKSVQHLLAMLAAYEADERLKVYITIAGRSNALSGLVDANVTAPVIACPPYSEEFGGMDLLSSLRMPSGVAPAVVLEPEAAALLAAKILGLTGARRPDGLPVHRVVAMVQADQRQRICEEDLGMRNAEHLIAEFQNPKPAPSAKRIEGSAPRTRSEGVEDGERRMGSR